MLNMNDYRFYGIEGKNTYRKSYFSRSHKLYGYYFIA